jgi:hypothetical protein
MPFLGIWIIKVEKMSIFYGFVQWPSIATDKSERGILFRLLGVVCFSAYLFCASWSAVASPFTYVFEMPNWSHAFGDATKFGSHAILDITVDNGSNKTKNQIYTNSQIVQVSVKAAGGGSFYETWSGSELSYLPNVSYVSTDFKGTPLLNLSIKPAFDPANLGLTGWDSGNSLQLANPSLEGGSFWPLAVATNNYSSFAALPDAGLSLSGAAGPKLSELLGNTSTGGLFVNPSGPTMFATFIPGSGFSLEEAAAIGGFDHFQWVQYALDYPGSILGSCGDINSCIITSGRLNNQVQHLGKVLRWERVTNN